ncbi:hypothetical protein GCM10009539_72470 [Cryptosporangium japonicum]|uniref:Uncharacterized protein n=1 Tax=Cryptosporangium japonicum TaxID=80872 RepID=A0ABP3EQQ8_9ACTN
MHSYALSQRFMLRETSVRVREILPPWVNTGPVGAAVASRHNAGPDEQAFVTALNEQMLGAFRA